MKDVSKFNKHIDKVFENIYLQKDVMGYEMKNNTGNDCKIWFKRLVEYFYDSYFDICRCYDKMNVKHTLKHNNKQANKFIKNSTKGLFYKKVIENNMFFIFCENDNRCIKSIESVEFFELLYKGK